MFLTQQPFEEHQTERDVQLKQREIRSTKTIKNNFDTIFPPENWILNTCRYVTYQVKTSTMYL